TTAGTSAGSSPSTDAGHVSRRPPGRRPPSVQTVRAPEDGRSGERMRPLIGISTYREQARWGAWDLPAVLLPASYADAVAEAGGEPGRLPTGGGRRGRRGGRRTGPAAARGGEHRGGPAAGRPRSRRWCGRRPGPLRPSGGAS